MSNVFGIITAIVLALSAFIALKNKSAYETKISETGTQKESLAKSEKRLAIAEEEMNVTKPNEISEVNASVAKLTADEEARQKSNAGLTTQVEDKTKKVASNKEKLDGIREKTSKVGDIKELASKIRTMNAEIVEMSASIDTSTAKLANLTAQNASSEAQVGTAKSKFENFSAGQSLPTLNTRIRSIYPNWGFVTLSAGNNAGVVTNSTLNVVRGGETIAQLLVTAVESGTASASIVPDSLASDVTLMVGDTVVPGVKSTKPAAAN